MMPGAGPDHVPGYVAAAVFVSPDEEMHSREKVRRVPTMEWAQVLHLVQ
jgi:hypothetical protein